MSELNCNTLSEKIRSVFSRNSDGDDGDVGPVVIEFEDVSETKERTFEYTIERTVAMINLQNGTLTIEYDDVIDGDMRAYKAVDAVTSADGSRRLTSRCAGLRYGNSVSTVNRMAVEHEQELGTFDVQIERTAEITVKYRRVENMDEIPEHALDHSGVPDRNENLVDDDGNEIRSRSGHGFETYNGDIVFNRRFIFDSWLTDTIIEPEKTMGDVIDNAVIGRTDGMRAVAADGSILMSSDQGTTSDMVQVHSLPSGTQQGDQQ